MDKKLSIIACLVGLSLIYLNLALAQPDLAVTGITAGEKPLAIVNGQVVKEGDIIKEAEIVEITENYVEFKYKDEVFTKHVGAGIKKREEKKTQREKQLIKPDASTYSSRIPNGYGKVKFGMSKKEIEKIMRQEGRRIKYIGGDFITAERGLADWGLLNIIVGVRYRLTPIAKKCYGIDIIIPGMDIAIPDAANYGRLERFLTKKFGKPTSPASSSSHLPHRKTIWEWKNVIMTLMDGEILNYPNKRIIGFVEKNLHAVMKKGRKSLR